MSNDTFYLARIIRVNSYTTIDSVSIIIEAIEKIIDIEINNLNKNVSIICTSRLFLNMCVTRN